MRRIFIVALLILCLLLLIACSKTESSYIVFGEAGVLTAQISTEEAGTLRIPSPAGTHAASCIGWKAQTANGTVFLPIGADYAYAAGEITSFSPVYFSLTTSSTASVSLTDNGDGIQFSTSISKIDWQALSNVTASITRGTLILSAEEAQTLTGSLTHASLAEAGKTAADLTSDAWLEETDSHYTFGAVLKDIPSANATTNYTAMGYVKITYSNGSETYVYANYGKDGAPAAAFYSFSAAVEKYLNITTLSSAMLDLTAKDGGICFVTSIPKIEWNALVQANGSLTRGTLILPADQLSLLDGSLTHAALNNKDVTVLDIPSTTWLTNTANQLTFGATITDIHAYERTVQYTAVGYIKITHSDNTVTYIYANYENGNKPQFSVITLAGAALKDLSDTQDSTYQYAVGDQFSPYTEEERATIETLSKYPVLLTSDNSIRGNKRLDPRYLAMFTERFIHDNNDADAEEWNIIYQQIGDTHYDDGGALILAAKDGTALTKENTGKIFLQNGTRLPEITDFIFYNGQLIIPYAVYTRPH